MPLQFILFGFYGKLAFDKTPKTMSTLRRLKHTVLRLSPEEKVIGLCGLIILAVSFMPWYSVTLSFENQSATESGFSGDLGVLGFMIFLLVLLAQGFMVGEHLHFKLPHFGQKKNSSSFFSWVRRPFCWPSW